MQAFNVPAVATLLLSLFVPVRGQQSDPTATSSATKTRGYELLSVKRIFIENFGETPIERQVQAMLISQISGSTRFRITELKENADAIMKGSAMELRSNEFHANSEETVSAGSYSSASAEVAGVFGSASASGVSGVHSTKDSSASTETVSDARIAVRLINKYGDVIWATVQESKGTKFTGAAADIAEKVKAQLLRDVERLENQSGSLAEVAGSKRSPQQIVSVAKTLLLTLEGDPAMEAEINKKLLKWGRMSLVSGSGKADLALSISQTGKFKMNRYGSAVTAAAVLRDTETGVILWSTTKGGFWSMSGASTRQVGGQIANELIKFLEQLSSAKHR
jgi:hypothetical protein